jgi:peptidoglycan/LPS O-acetylase OafA/YrhL
MHVLSKLQAHTQPQIIRPHARRSDIDGLRGVAVFGVVAFHLGFAGVTGGYTGVDVFFVISGYLIAGIVALEIAQGRFSLAGFYERRVRRILPAVLTMTIASTLMAILIFLPSDFQEYGRSLLSVTTFSSNYYFVRKTDYFSGNVEEMPLLHTWSLAIEEQYYLVFPLLILALLRRGLGTARAAFAALALCSFIYSCLSLESVPETAFFATPARVWELLIGALLALGVVPSVRSAAAREVLTATGLALILVCYIVYTPDTVFPGMAALAPCIGAGLILHAGASGSSRTASLLSVPLLAGLGLISYSVYLWHWPLLVFSKYRFPDLFDGANANPAVAGIAVGCLSIAAGYLSWRFIEKPFQARLIISRARPAFGWAAVTSVALSVLAIAIYRGDGWWWRWPTEIAAVKSWQAADAGNTIGGCQPMPADQGWPGRVCSIGSKGQSNSIVIWGDSHARGLASALEAQFELDARGIIVAVSPGCPPLLNVGLYGRSKKNKCAGFTEAVMAKIISDRIKHVVIAARWAYYAEGTRYGREGGAGIILSPDGISSNGTVVAAALENTLRTLAGHGVEVTLVGPIPEQAFHVASAMMRKVVWSGAPIPNLTYKAFQERQKHVLPALMQAARNPKVTVLFPHESLCSAESCRYQRDDRPLYSDNDHLNCRGWIELDGLVRKIATRIRKSLNEVPGTTIQDDRTLKLKCKS